ncbi:hypothetical protein MYSTI_01948 [Myxococcus stipitatus DSM 14675]|uniref:Minor tail protein n=1 Tax=Myxococcus stipitatus (strain DSM 14675 / JCM 12634 / Mx s8) TaxID=1278073 RepID=L7U6R8_MYXSD|nr:hypothetical protein [Myxococcus stipitatus]AGC43277.1 hypothetical protein MYSTI_01948 [Myxococcus stipitatus DSM 14675]
MAKEFSVTWDSKSSAYLKEKKTLKALAAAARKAGIDMMRAVRAEAKRETRERIRIRAGYLAAKAMPLKYPKTRKLDEMEWRMPVSGREVPLGEFPSRQTKKGVSLEVQRGKRVLIKGAFRAQGAKRQRPGVFKRPGKKRYPMGHKLGLRVSDSMHDGKTPTKALTRGQEVFARGMTRLLPLELAKIK